MGTSTASTAKIAILALLSGACGEAAAPAPSATAPPEAPVSPAPPPVAPPPGSPGAVRLPQFVRGVAGVNPGAFPKIPVVVEAGPDAREVEVRLDEEALPVVRDGARFVATATIGGIPEGEHTVIARERSGPETRATLVLSRSSTQVTRFADQGTARTATLHHDLGGDRLLASWVDRRDGALRTYVAELDGAGRRLRPDALVTPGEETLRVYSAMGEGHLGLLTQAAKGTAWTAHVRVVRPDGTSVAPPVELTGADTAYQGAAIAWSKRGYVAVWQHITPPSAVTELRLAFVDPKTGAASAPVVLAREDDAQTGGKLAHLGLFGVACNDAVCAATYVRDLHVNVTDLDTTKVHVAVVDLATGARRAAFPVDRRTWDLQEDPSVAALPDGSFAIAYVGASTKHLDPEACGPEGMMMDRKLLHVARLTKEGALVGVSTVVDEQAPRFQPGLAALPSGLAVAWEDQRSQCSGGTNRLALNGVDAAGKLRGPYVEVRGTRLIGQVWPSLAPAGTNAVVAFMNDLTGSILSPRPEMWIETYWGP